MKFLKFFLIALFLIALFSVVAPEDVEAASECKYAGKSVWGGWWSSNLQKWVSYKNKCPSSYNGNSFCEYGSAQITKRNGWWYYYYACKYNVPKPEPEPSAAKKVALCNENTCSGKSNWKDVSGRQWSRQGCNEVEQKRQRYEEYGCRDNQCKVTSVRYRWVNTRNRRNVGNGQSCNDGNSCTLGDTCSAGSCTGTKTTQCGVCGNPACDRFPSSLDYNSGVSNYVGFDSDKNGKIDFSDFLAFMNSYDSSRGEDNYKNGFDSDNNGEIEFSDFLLFAQEYGKDVPIYAKPKKDEIKEELKECDIQCSDPDDCSCPSECRVKGEIGMGGSTCGGKESFFDIFRRTQKTVKNTCDKNLKLGESCEVEFEFEVLNSKGETLGLDVDFKWNGGSYSKRVDLRAGDSNIVSGTSSGNAVIGNVILDITGNVAQNLVTERGRFRCEIVKPSEDPTLLRTCCPKGFMPSIQSGVTQCVKEPDLISQIIGKMGEYLRTKDSNLAREIQRLENQLMSLQ